MKNAQKAMKAIHGGLTVDKVDQTMQELEDQHAVGEEIAEALTQGASRTGVDEDELEDELAELQQEELDNKMLKTGSVPVNDQIQRLPSAAVGERKHFLILPDPDSATMLTIQKARTRVEEEDEEEELKKLQAEMAM